jgi:hypothetical protein
MKPEVVGSSAAGQEVRVFSREKLRDCRFFSMCFGVSWKATSLSIWLLFQNPVVMGVLNQ